MSSVIKNTGYLLSVIRYLFSSLSQKFDKRAISFACLAHIVGWVKRDVGTIYVGFAYFNVPQQSEIASKLANPTRSVAEHRLNPTYDLSFRPIKWIHPFDKKKLVTSFVVNVETFRLTLA